MRIALVNWSARQAGGAESYLADVMPALARGGHQVRLWRELDRPTDRAPITHDESFALTADEIGRMRDWKPDLVYCHGVTDTDRERQVLAVAPGVFFAHSYYGACISGSKTWSFPSDRPCRRRLGPGCLVHFYPHRCGGLNPGTMMRDYLRQTERRRLLSAYAAIVTNSIHMRDEYLRQGLPAEKVHKVFFPVPGSAQARGRGRHDQTGPLRLAFVGRMDRLKGGEYLLDALPHAQRRLGRAVELIFAGDGPERSAWQQKATAMSAASGIAVRFAGWLDPAALEQLYQSLDLLVFPSVWPEPFGLAGLQAGIYGVPVAAFATGGVTEWLKDGVNGFTAPGDQPRASELAVAMIRCLENAEIHQRLSDGAIRNAEQFTMEAHLRELLQLFEHVRT